MPERTCAHCGAPFTTNNSRKVTCSLNCRAAVKYIRAKARGTQYPAADAECVICGNSFRRSYPGQRACGRSCGVEVIRMVRTGAMDANSVNLRPSRGVKRTEQRICVVCDRSFRTVQTSEARACGKHRGLAKYVGLSEPIPWARCLACERWLINRHGHPVCGKQCYDHWYNHTHRPRSVAPLACPECGCAVDVRFKKCPECRRAANRARKNREGDKKRAELCGVAYEPINRRRVYQRDGWTCGICGDSIDPEAKWPDTWCASLDHVVPMSKGGSHTYDNVQAAHHWCNTMKRDSEDFDLKVA